MSELCSKKLCMGCTACYAACAASAISMEPDEKGFLHPVVNTKLCTRCGVCKRVCPAAYGLFDDTEAYSQRFFALIHKSSDVLEHSASGGAFTSICEWMFNLFPHDTVCFGAAFDEGCKTVLHGSASSIDEIKSFKGSKYVQSCLGGIFLAVRAELEKKKYVIFTGTPCQVAGLKHYLKAKHVSRDRLVLCDIICHGVPSPLIWATYLNFIEKENHAKVVRAAMRSKRRGWRKFTPYVSLNNGKIRDGNLYPDVRSYMQLFFNGLIYRESCYHCQYATMRRVSDITLADFWGIEKVCPEINTSKGASLVLVNTSKGQSVLEGMARYANIVEVFSEEFINFQRNLRAPVDVPKNRDMFWKDFLSNGYRYIAIKYGKYDIVSRLKCFAKRIIVNSKFF